MADELNGKGQTDEQEMTLEMDTRTDWDGEAETATFKAVRPEDLLRGVTNDQDVTQPGAEPPESASDELEVAGEDTLRESESSPQVILLEQIIGQLRADLAEKHQRVQEIAGAFRRKELELDRIRERLERDREKQLLNDKNRLFSMLFAPLDNLQASIRSLEKIPNSDSTSLLEGLINLQRTFTDALAAMGLERIDPAGEAFDPEFHEALSTIPVSSPRDHNRVLDVMRAGYVSEGIVVRPASVIVGRYQD
jgi:molecular chaperone GrpE